MLTYLYGSSANAKDSASTKPGLAGSVVRVWEKDPTVTRIGDHGTMEILLTGQISDGPSDKSITIMGRPVVKADEENNFIFDPKTDKESFDTVQTFSYVHRVHNMYSRSLNHLGLDDKLNWQWGASPIKVLPDAGVMENAYYSRQDKSLNFFHFQSEENEGETIYTCEAEDIVAHETGHAVLDALCPGFLESYNPQTGAIHESFGDQTTIFLLLDDMQVCEQVITHSKGDLLKLGLFLPDLANQFGEAIGQKEGLRNANNDLKVSEVGTEVHALSQVLTGAMYKILAHEFNKAVNVEKEKPSDTLHRTAFNLRNLLINALKKGPKVNASFADLANQMIALTPDADLKTFIKSEFTNRGVDFNVRLENVPMEDIEKMSYSTCSGTLNSKQAIELREKAIEARKAEIQKANERSYYSPMRLLGY